MQYCTSCQKSVATIMIADIQQAGVVGQQHLCAACAENAGLIPAKPSLKLGSEALEGLLGLGSTTRRREPKAGEATCPGCGLTMSQFKQRARMGCPRCYEVFRAHLVPLLERVHDASSHRGRYLRTQPEQPQAGSSRRSSREQIEALHKRLALAIQNESYEEAASLRDELRRLEQKADARDDEQEHHRD